MNAEHFGIDPRKKKTIISGSRPVSRTAATRPVSRATGTRPISEISQSPRPSTALTMPIRFNNSPQKTQTIHTAFAQTTYQNFTNNNDDSMPTNVHLQFEKIISNTKTSSLQDSVESGMILIFSAEQCYLWFVVEKNSFFSPTKNQVCEENRSILSYVCKNQSIFNSSRPSSSPNFDKTVDFEFSPTLYIPIVAPDSKIVIAIIQIIRPVSQKFSVIDINAASSLQEKFQLYSHLIFDTKYSSNSIEIATSKSKTIIAVITEQLKTRFHCRSIEFWVKNEDDSYSKYDAESNTYVNSNPGLVKQSFETSEDSLCFISSKSMKYYDESVDGTEDDSILQIPYKLGEQKCSVCLRKSRLTDGCFSFSDERKMKHLVPLISKCILYENGNDPAHDLATKLKMLLEVAEIISGVMDIEILVPTIMDRACSLLRSERCSLFLVDSKKEKLITTVQSGLDKSITIPINRGIVGHTATTGAIVNIEDAYNDSRFDKSFDQDTGFKTKTILSVPIYDNRGEIIGVTEMINREDGKIFDEDDIKMMAAFNVFCGISIDNTRLYQASLDLTRQLRGFIEMSNAINKSDSSSSSSIRNMLESIITSAKEAVCGTRATLFMKNEDSNSLFVYINNGEQMTYGTKFSSQLITTKKSRVFTPSDISSMTANPRNEVIDPEAPVVKEKKESTSKYSRLSTVLNADDQIVSQLGKIQAAETSETICCFPLLKSDDMMMGVLEISCKRRRTLPEDVKLLECFSQLVTISLERNALQLIATLGRSEVELKKYINPNERTQIGVIPTKLKITRADSLFKIGFDASSYEGIGTFKVLWAIFDYFKLFREFKVKNETFFKFLDSISHTYKSDVPYHNWVHAIDVCQFITYSIKTAKLEQKFTKLELFALLVAAICHDASHEGFTNAFNIQAETPLGILFKNQSVMETHHCSVAIEIMAKEECNIFDSLDSTKLKEVWNLIISLILITDMIKHNDFIAKVNDMLSKGSFDYKNPEHRLILMQLILKCADISNVSRPFEIANKWCDVLCEEFFRQGDLEKTKGMEYTSPLNDRAHLDKPKSQIGFYTFVCLPLYQTTAKAIPMLKVNAEQVTSNLAVWKKETEKKNSK